MCSFIVLCGLLASMQAIPRPGTSAGADAQKIEEYLDAWEACGQLSGVVLAARDDEIVFQRAYGLADVEHETPNSVATRFQVASVTKTFTAAAVLLLRESGVLELTDPVSKFLPDYPRGGEITVEHLLSHSSGIPDHHGLPGFREKTAGGITLEELVRWQSEFPLEYDPGTDDEYVNSGFALLAYLVQVASGETFPGFVRANFLEPLGMDSTGEVTAGIEGMAQGYLYGPPPAHRIATEPRDWSYAMGSGSMYSTAADLLRWLRAVDAKTIVDFDRPRWPYGWGKATYGRYAAIDQTGMHDGFTATISVVPEADVYVVHLSNLQVGLPFQRVHRDLVRILLGLPYEPPPRFENVPFDPASAKRLIGRYAGGRWRPTLSVRSDGLFLRWNDDDPPRYLEPLARDRYLLVADGCQLLFSPSEEGSPPRFELREPWNPGGPYETYERVP